MYFSMHSESFMSVSDILIRSWLIFDVIRDLNIFLVCILFSHSSTVSNYLELCSNISFFWKKVKLKYLSNMWCKSELDVPFSKRVAIMSFLWLVLHSLLHIGCPIFLWWKMKRYLWAFAQPFEEKCFTIKSNNSLSAYSNSIHFRSTIWFCQYEYFTLALWDIEMQKDTL